MKNYIGIDLGTTNSAICSYDGINTHIWKSPEQNDVTPSAIFVDKRGKKYYGNKAYNQAPYNPNNSATLFKRFMGTSTKIQLEASGLTLTPEECSAEILKVLFGYLPEEIRNDSETATVITVPAAFNQMRKDATLQAAKLAGLGNVALILEPVAAIMSIVKQSNQEGIFLVYDLGGGTFDVSVAENIDGKINLLSHGGIEMCGGRDIDRMIFNQIVIPWLKSKFVLPDDFLFSDKYKTFCRAAQWATERAKIELSAVDLVTIALDEEEARIVDEEGNEIYIDIDISRDQVDYIISDLVNETISTTKEILTRVGLSTNDIERIVFVGGPTNYKPLRDTVCFKLSLKGNIDVNPMTAVVEGASIFAESIDWSTQNHNRKATNQTITTNIDLSFKYMARTSDNSAKIMCVLGDELKGYSIEFVSLDNGWSSGNIMIKANMMVSLPLSQNGENRFRANVFDEFGRKKEIENANIFFSKILATVDSIPASFSIGVEVIEKLGGASTLEYLVNEGDSLPKKGTISLKSGQTLKAGSKDSINIKLWEGDIQSPVSDNRFIGVLKIRGNDIACGTVPIGADIVCEYEMSDSGTICLEALIPCIGATFSNHNFYSRQEGQIDLSDVNGIAKEGRHVLLRIREVESKVDDTRLKNAREKAEIAANIDRCVQCDLEDVQKANNQLLAAKKLLNTIRQDNIKQIRQMDLDKYVQDFNQFSRKYATEIEERSFDVLTQTAQRSIDRDENDFVSLLDNLINISAKVIVRQDFYIIQYYTKATMSSNDYVDIDMFEELKKLGDEAVRNDDMLQLRKVISRLDFIKIKNNTKDKMFEIVNIVKG